MDAPTPHNFFSSPHHATRSTARVRLMWCGSIRLLRGEGSLNAETQDRILEEQAKRLIELRKKLSSVTRLLKESRAEVSRLGAREKELLAELHPEGVLE